MTYQDPLSSFVPKFGVGQPVHRKEDPRLLRGEGRYTDDVAPEGLLHTAFVRSNHAHGRLISIDCDAARASDGVVLVLTSAELEGQGYKDIGCGLPLKSADGSPMIVPPHPPLARGKVLYVGQPIVAVIAETQAQAQAACELVSIDIEPLPAVVDMVEALTPGAPQLHSEAPANVVLDWSFGDHDAVDKAFAGAAHVTRLRVVNNRVMVVAMEPRGAVISYDTERWTVTAGSQGPFGLRNALAGLLGVPTERVRVLTEDVGGSFGMKGWPYPEYLPSLHAARELGRPVKWMNDRSASFLGDWHGRDSVYDAELALDAEGNFLAVRLDGIGNAGGFTAGFGPGIPTMVVQKNLPGLYRTPLMGMRVKVVLTNTTPLTAYRGAGRPEAVYIMERLVDAAARETGRDRLDLRRKNLIAPESMPFAAASGVNYDSGEFATVIDKTLELSDWSGFAARRKSSAVHGKLRGIGVASYLEITAAQGKEMGGLRFNGDGRITLTTGTLDYGQGHASAFAQVLSERLGLPFDRIDLVQNDSDVLLHGGGTGGSRSIMASGEAILAAADAVVEKGRKMAADQMEAALADIVFDNGQFAIAGTDRSVSLLSLASDHPGELDAALVADTPVSSCPNGCHIAEVEIDPDTGRIVLDRYTAVDDFGTLVNPMLVEGQVHGGVTQAIGQVLGEDATYAADGQLLAGSFMDYAMPRADWLPSFELDFHPVPATTNRLGVKGCGEAGVSAGLPAVMNAIVDALGERGIHDLDMPATPERIWRALHAVR